MVCLSPASLMRPRRHRSAPSSPPRGWRCAGRGPHPTEPARSVPLRTRNVQQNSSATPRALAKSIAALVHEMSMLASLPTRWSAPECCRSCSKSKTSAIDTTARSPSSAAPSDRWQARRLVLLCLGQKSAHIQMVDVSRATGSGWARASRARGSPPRVVRPARMAWAKCRPRWPDWKKQVPASSPLALITTTGTEARATFPEIARHRSSPFRSGRKVVEQQQVQGMLGCGQDAELAAIRGRHTEARLGQRQLH